MTLYRQASIACGVLSVVLAVVYQASFTNGFHYDDFHSIVENPHIRSLGRLPDFFVDPSLFSGMPGRGMYRPILLSTYALNYAIGGYGLVGYHVVNWLLHLGCALWVYALGRRLHGQWSAALFGALVFALHPLATEPVNYISSRSESLAAFFYLASLFGYVCWRLGAGRWFWLLSVAAFACGLLSKSVTIVLPVALWVYERWGRVDRPIRPISQRKNWLYYVPYWAIICAYLLQARSWLGDSLSSPVRDISVQLATQAKALIYYVHLLIVPTRLTVEHPFSVAQAIGDGAVVLSCVAIASGVWFVRRHSLVLLFGCWAILPLLPASIVPLNVLVNEHRLYLPLALLGLALGWGLRQGMSQRNGLIALVLLALCASLTHARSLVWRDELSLWSDAVRKAPAMYRTHLHLGGALEKEGQVRAALVQYEQALALEPDAVEVHYNRGRALILLQQFDAGLAAYERCLQLEPQYLPAQINLAALYQDVGQLARAEDLLRSALAHSPDEAEVWRRLGVLHKMQGKGSEAVAMYTRALSLDPALVEARYNLGNLYRDQGRWQEAERAFQRVIRERDEHAGAYRNLGDLLLERGQYRAAVEIWNRGLRRLPQEVIFYYGLGQAYEAQNRIEAAIANYRRFIQSGTLNPQQLTGLKSHVKELEDRQR